METTVTARMAQGAKDAANDVFAQLGTNSSRAINDFYAYVIEHRALPDGVGHVSETSDSPRIDAALAWVDALSCTEEDEHFTSMTDQDIRDERLASRGLL